MNEIPQKIPRKKKILIAALSVVAVGVLTGGAVVGVNASTNSKNAQACADATTAGQAATKVVTDSMNGATKADALAQGVDGYSKHKGADVFLKDVGAQKATLAAIDLNTNCATRDDAAKIQANAESATAQVTLLDAASKKLATEVSAFQESEKKRVADEKAAAAAAAKKKAEAEKAKAEKEAADAAAAEAAQQQVVPEQPAEGGDYAPAPQVPSNNYIPGPAPYVPPAPAPYVPPAPAPAPAPQPNPGGGGGGWTPPPAGGGGGGGCTQIGDHIMC